VVAFSKVQSRAIQGLNQDSCYRHAHPYPWNLCQPGKGFALGVSKSLAVTVSVFCEPSACQ
jgi:hypothetical protein